MKNQQRVDKKDFGRDLGKKDRVLHNFFLWERCIIVLESMFGNYSAIGD